MGQIGDVGGSEKREVVEVRVRIGAELARRLDVAAAIRRASPSELVEWALIPHLDFVVPDLPEICVSPSPFPRVAGREGARKGRGQAEAERGVA
jgi:hypothetical protein